MGEYLSADVYLEEVASDVRTIEAASTTTCGVIGITARGPIAEPVLITSFAAYLRNFGSYIENGWLTYAVERFFKYVKGRIYVVRTAHYTDITDPDSYIAVLASTGGIKDRAGTPVDTITIDAANEGAWGNDISIEVVASTADPDNEFAIEVSYDGVPVETFDDLNMTATSRNYVVSRINDGKSAYINVTDLASASTPPENRPELGVKTFTLGDDGLTGFDDDDIVGNSGAKTGLYALDAVDDLFLLAAPGYYSQTVHNGLITYTESRLDCHAILDSPLGMTPTEVVTYVQATAAFNAKYAFFYYPWIIIRNPNADARMTMPPSGDVLGVIVRTILKRGIHKAPAGIEDGRLNDVLAMEVDIDKGTRDVLYPARINPIIKKTGRGFLVWGNKTLSAESDWRDINVRLLFTFLENSIIISTDWAVFEPNDEDLWDALGNSIRIFLLGQWRDGRFYDGGTGDYTQAFYVKCDEELNTQSVIDQHKVICEVGVAPKKAAEFIIIRLTQWDGGRLIEELTST